MKIINKDLGNRLWGMSFTLFFVSLLYKEYPLWAKILACFILGYFLYFGNSRFGDNYEKII